MPTLTIYDSEGNEYSPTGNATGTSQQIKNLNLASVRFAVQPGRETRFVAYFRAKETEHARAEQFYAEYTTRDSSNPAGAFIDAIKNQVDEWGHTLDASADEMAVFQTVQNAHRATTPGTKNDRTILSELLSGRQLVTVGVSDASAALGLLQSFESYSVAITDSQNADSLSGFDLAIVMGRHRGIEPLGSTVDRWEQTKQSLQTQLVNEEINQIKQSVQTLKQEHGLSSSEIRNRVSRKVPALSTSSSGGNDRIGGSQNDSITDKLLSPQVGKYVFFGSIILLVLLAAGWGAATLGMLPGSGDDTTISGIVYDSDGEPLESQNVTLSGGSLENDTQVSTRGSGFLGLIGNPGAYEFADVEDGNYTVRVDHPDYEYDQQEAQPGDTDVDFEPVDSETEGNGDGGTDDETEESIDADTEDSGSEEIDETDESEETTGTNSEESIQSDVSGTVNIVPDKNQRPRSTTVTLSDGGEFTRTAAGIDDDIDDGADFDRFSGATDFTDVPHDEYTVEVTADGHEPDSQTITVTEETDEFELDLIEYSSLTLTVVDESDSDQTLEGADITLTGEDGDEVDSGASNQDGQFTADSLLPQVYTIAVSLEEYDDAEVEIELEPGEDEEDQLVELTPESA